MPQIELTTTHARRAATSLAAKVAEMDSARTANWWNLPTDCRLTQKDKEYRQELLGAYDAIMKQI